MTGSGEFVPVREWTCPEHEYPQRDEIDHDCNCSHCAWVPCGACQAAEWRDKVDADGNAVMREITAFESLLRKMPPPRFPDPVIWNMLVDGAE